MATFEKLLPLEKESCLSSDSIAQLLWEMSEGLIGELSEIINRSGKAAIANSTEKITLSALQKMDWLPPSSRRRKAETLLEG